MADHIWKRREDETAKSFEAFRTYIEMPPMERSIRAVAEQYDREPRNYQDWSSKYDWVDRAAAYDAWLAEQADEEIVDAIRRTRAEIAKVGPRLARRLVDIAQVDSDEPNPTVVRAILGALDRMGVSTPKDLNISGGMSLEHLLMDIADEDEAEE